MDGVSNPLLPRDVGENENTFGFQSLFGKDRIMERRLEST